MTRLRTIVSVAVTVLVSAPAAHASRPWRAPVAGPVTRGFDLGSDAFAPGRHRGADFAARPGATVRSACTGRVVFAGRVGTSGRVVTVRCGPWRATHMPLAQLAVHAGETVRRGTPIGTLAPSAAHDGVHLGARRDGTRFGYADPLTLIGADHRSPLPLVAPARPPRSPRPVPAPARRAAPASPRAASTSPRAARPASRAPVHPAPAHLARDSSPVAPWPVWAGLAVLLAGAAGTGVRVGITTRRAPVPHGVAREVP